MNYTGGDITQKYKVGTPLECKEGEALCISSTVERALISRETRLVMGMFHFSAD